MYCICTKLLSHKILLYGLYSHNQMSANE
uniref:Uncharacterized protein n=1 Tax=Anguilla anguilla TaxID=7936 RepID=A0A0E9VE00_ANGAN